MKCYFILSNKLNVNPFNILSHKTVCKKLSFNVFYVAEQQCPLTQIMLVCVIRMTISYIFWLLGEALVLFWIDAQGQHNKRRAK